MTFVSGHVYTEVERERESWTDGRKDILQGSSLNFHFVLVITLNLNRNTDVCFGFIVLKSVSTSLFLRHCLNVRQN